MCDCYVIRTPYVIVVHVDLSCLVVVISFIFFFFFFQAEDGIRDGHVTGVQTCALPISNPTRRAGSGSIPCRDSAVCTAARSPCAVAAVPLHRASSSTNCAPARLRCPACIAPHRTGRVRSEERRVGKECRSGVARWHGRE